MSGTGGEARNLIGVVRTCDICREGEVGTVGISWPGWVGNRVSGGWVCPKCTGAALQRVLDRLAEIVFSDLRWVDTADLQNLLNDIGPVDPISGLTENEMKAKYVRCCSYWQVWIKGQGWTRPGTEGMEK